MPRTTAFLVAALAIVLIAAGPAAASTAAAGNAPTIVTEPIDDFNVHEEPDGSVTTSRVTGSRTTMEFPDGRYMLRERYTLHQTSTDPSGAVVFDSTSDTSVKVIAEGERTVLFSLTSEGTTTLADGSECTFSTTFLVANDRLIKNEQTGPICS